MSKSKVFDGVVMGKLYYLMGKSSSGKDTLYKMLMGNESLGLKKILPYTTRPIRDGEKEGVEYHFTNKAGLDELNEKGKVVESRCYNTVHGDWYYFTVDDENIDFHNNDYLMIGTLESYEKIRDYYGKNLVVDIYIDTDDGIRLERALKREREQKEPKYKEMCRRFLADAEDFSEEKLAKLEVNNRFVNDRLEICYKEICDYIICKK